MQNQKRMEYYCKKCGEVCIRKCGMVICLKCGYEVEKDKADRDNLLDACEWLYSQWLMYADQRYLTNDEKGHKKRAKAAIDLANEQ